MIDQPTYRYLFLVRAAFASTPRVDAFYEVQIPPDITSEQAQIMQVLNPDFCKDEIQKDSVAIKGMTLRLRFNQDMFQKVCLVKTTVPITAEDLDTIIGEKHRNGKLEDFLNDAAIKT